jgi:hypothetical protein
MNKTMTAGWMLAGALSVGIMSLSPAAAQSALGGAKLQQNKIGGVAKPAPIVGGANTHATVAPKPPVPVVVSRSAPPTPGAVGGVAPAGQQPSGRAAGNARVNPAVVTPNKSGGALGAAPKVPKP